LREIEEEEEEEKRQKIKQGVYSKNKGGNYTQTKQGDKVFAPQILQQQKALFQNSQPPALFGNNFVPPGSTPGSAPVSMSSFQGSNLFGGGFVSLSGGSRSSGSGAQQINATPTGCLDYAKLLVPKKSDSKKK
jgi:hypothetical protein